jgi:hypothetical protein
MQESSQRDIPEAASSRVWADLALMMYALALALRFARAISQSSALDEDSRDKVGAIVDQCYRKAPGIRPARDWIEHMDDQLRGKGKPAAPAPTDVGELVRSSTTGEVFGIRIGGIMIEPCSCLAAVQAMARDVLEVVDLAVEKDL